MVLAVGTDSGTKSMDIFGFDDQTGGVIVDRAIPRDEVTKNPEVVIEELRRVQEKFGELDCIVASSGYGVPLKKAEDAAVEEVNLATFITKKDLERRLKIVGLRELMMTMRKANDLNIYFSPGVVQLPTVPEYRKANKIDLGTSDKVYTAALAVKDQSERLNLDYRETSLIAVEIGFAYTSAMAIEQGRITDATAGTAGFPGYMGLGHMDSELSYALGNTNEDLSKMSIFQGGAAYVAGMDPLQTSTEEFVKRGKTEERRGKGYNLMLESIAKDITSLLPTIIPREIILSGRFTKIPGFMNDLTKKLEKLFKNLGQTTELVNLKTRGETCKEAAEGAAIVANGIAGGKHEDLAENMRIKESSGSIFDHLYLTDKYIEKLETFKR
ncbi:hypothetical protein AKJ37_04685 [candidate division MSBL1 archaeon SCGC-AAA259I09]|uniref:Butyrate kinase n=1 Tax=candidate division MSBL1 archaeon SCGC-AAA259I09 TaxID=1698267 RepID=A0A133URA2_9EURY|nr:hypothetical protein AKJ37_04685 [candidate division MSBL1 archaeon SCGC-AAA259I09]